MFDLLWAWTGFFVPEAGADEKKRWAAQGEEIISDYGSKST